MLIHCVGVMSASYDFTNDKGQHIQTKGFRIFYTYESSKIQGVGTDSVYLSEARVAVYNAGVPEVGKDYMLSYNRYGKVMGISPVE